MRGGVTELEEPKRSKMFQSRPKDQEGAELSPACQLHWPGFQLEDHLERAFRSRVGVPATRVRTGASLTRAIVRQHTLARLTE